MQTLFSSSSPFYSPYNFFESIFAFMTSNINTQCTILHVNLKSQKVIERVEEIRFPIQRMNRIDNIMNGRNSFILLARVVFPQFDWIFRNTTTHASHIHQSIKCCSIRSCEMKCFYIRTIFQLRFHDTGLHCRLIWRSVSWERGIPPIFFFFFLFSFYFSHLSFYVRCRWFKSI